MIAPVSYTETVECKATRVLNVRTACAPTTKRNAIMKENVPNLRRTKPSGASTEYMMRMPLNLRIRVTLNLSM